MAWKFINSPITQKPLGVHSWNLYTMWVIINNFCKPSLGAPGHVTKMLQAENGQKVDEFETIHLHKYRFWWKMICAFWAHYQPPLLVMFVYPILNTIFLLLIFSYFFFFFFSAYLLLNRWTHCIQSLSGWRYQAGLVREWNRGCQVEGTPLNRALQNFELLNC